MSELDNLARCDDDAWVELDALRAEVARLTAELKHESKAHEENLKIAATQNERLTAENERLRAALANSELPCVYCTLPAAEWAKCEKGFPGCDRADDAMGCPELGATKELADLRRRVNAVHAQIQPPDGIHIVGGYFINAGLVDELAAIAKGG